MPLDDVLLQELPDGPASLCRLRDSVGKMRAELAPISQHREELPHMLRVDLRVIEIDLAGIEAAVEDVITADEFKDLADRIARLLHIFIAFNKRLGVFESTGR